MSPAKRASFAVIPCTTLTFYGNLPQIRNDITSNLKVGLSIEDNFQYFMHNTIHSKISYDLCAHTHFTCKVHAAVVILNFALWYDIIFSLHRWMPVDHMHSSHSLCPCYIMVNFATKHCDVAIMISSIILVGSSFSLLHILHLSIMTWLLCFLLPEVGLYKVD